MSAPDFAEWFEAKQARARRRAILYMVLMLLLGVLLGVLGGCLLMGCRDLHVHVHLPPRQTAALTIQAEEKAGPAPSQPAMPGVAFPADDWQDWNEVWHESWDSLIFSPAGAAPAQP